MEHNFNVEVATDYSIEKAVILNNLYFWCAENAANGRNIYKGRAYTYNTAEAYAELFPYFKPRKIAELLRQLEADGLIMSAQVHGTNRVKSYTLTDKALEYYTSVHSSIQNNVNPLYINATMDNTEIEHCTITDNKHTNKNTDREAASDPAPVKKFKKPTREEVAAYCHLKSLRVDVDRFIDYYESNGWKVGRSSMKDWKAAARNWASREKTYSKPRSKAGAVWQMEEGQDVASMYEDIVYK